MMSSSREAGLFGTQRRITLIVHAYTLVFVGRVAHSVTSHTHTYTHACAYRPPDKVFTSFVVRGQLVEAEEVVERFFAPLHKSQTDIYFDLYGTHARDASYLDEPGMRLLGKAVLQLPEGWDQCEDVRREGTWGYIVQAELRFGTTEVTLTARNPRTHETVATSVEWSSDVADAVRDE
ncbi:hypothetical protein Vretimale_9303 [Volvox reticuliferus]|uniref:Uncharacterized protein n=1 Tax=Volvox reticuliferus TaxID=1737510 RepID=A0A8J4GDA2_9CHLO|nr:hypothetical protein Vretifemale_10145 [Volvox reticuliferus]GIM04798.1 hypothetical protein Vretimale_9303 [Volvox reticuliferus]